MPFNPASSLAKLIDAPVRPGEVVWIGTRPIRRAEMRVEKAAFFEAGKGLIGDRYSSIDGARQVTLIQAESLVTIGIHLGREIAPQDLRRNIVVSGINLLALKGRRFRIGGVSMEASGECHPCSRMEEILGTGASMQFAALAESRRV